MAERGLLLVPLDGSDLAEAALPYAEALARSLAEPLHLLAVVDREPGEDAELPPEFRDHLLKLRRQGLDEYLTMRAASSAGRGVTVETEIVEGDPVSAILAAADRLAVDAIIMATHGRGGFERLFLGSVADKIMRLGRHPTLLVAPHENVEPQEVQLHRIAVPLDGSPLAEAALAPAERLAAAAGAQLLLTRVQPLTLIATDAYGYVPDLGDIEAALMKQVQAYLADVQGRLSATVASETVVLRGDPAATLAQYVHEQRVDLLVMTTHGRGGVQRLVLGSTADRLVRLGLPVLLIRLQA